MSRKLIYTLICIWIYTDCVLAQNIQVKGTITSSEDGEPVIGATVHVKGTTIGTVTNVEGHFTLAVPSDNKTLVFSYVGMTTVEEEAKSVMNVVLHPSSEALDEVIVVAYGTAKKSSFTGSATSISGRDLDMRPVNSVAQALEGAAAGVQVNSANGQPGKAPEIRVRGFGTINASANPLYVVDGAIYDGSIADINMSDIENMTILKDAASTSLYGSSAGNGVILITTKHGKSDKPTITFSTTQGITSRAVKEYERVSIWQYYPLMWEQIRNQKITDGMPDMEAGQYASDRVFGELFYNPFRGVANNAIVSPDGMLNPDANQLLWGDDLDWEKAMQRTGYRGEYNVNYSAGSDKSDMFVSLGYLKDNGYIIKSDFERFSGRANVNIMPVKWLKTGLNLAASRSKSQTANTNDNSSGYANPFFFTRNIGPIYPIHEHDRITGEYILDPEGNKIYDYLSPRGSGASSGRNIVAETLFNSDSYTRDAFTARTYFDLFLMEGLKATINATLENSNENVTSYDNKLVGDGQGSGRLRKTNRRRSTYSFNQLVSYTKNFGKHGIDALVGHENYAYTYEYMYGMRQGEAQPGLLSFDNFTDINSLSSYTDTYRKEGYFLRTNYNYADTYYASFSFRHDGTSRFKKGYRWGNFWSLGGSWRIDHEDFMKNLTWVNSLKVRASYGETGNDAGIGYYPYMTLYELGQANGGEAGLLFNTFGNPSLKWEAQVSYDAAVEFGLFDRLTGSVEYFVKQSRDLLFKVPTPLTSGVLDIWQNIGKVSNSGVEITLNTQIIREKNWSWDIGINATFVKNRIKQLPNKEGIIDGTKKLQVGESIYQYWLKEFMGVREEDGSAMYRFDGENQNWNPETCFVLNGDSITTNQALAKYHYAGSSIPTVYGGINTAVKYKNWTLNMAFTYQLGGKTYDSSYQQLMSVNSFGQALHKDILNRWTQAGDQTNVPRLDSGQSTNFNTQSDRWLFSSNSFTIKAITLSYSLSNVFLNRFGIQNAKVSFSGENLYMSSALRGMNPLQGFNGISNNQYLPTRTLTFGLSVTL